MAERVKLGWEPQWDTSLQKITANYLRKNKFYADVIESNEDLMQDAFLVFMKVKRAYPRVIDPPHFVALYKTALRNAMMDKARYRQGKLEAISPADPNELYSPNQVEYNNGFLLAALAELPPELMLVLKTLIDPSKEVELRRRSHKVRENLSMKLCRILGLDPELDVIKQLKERLA